jgi:hypothetical protein
VQPTLADGNALLPAFIADYNARFAKSAGKQRGFAAAVERRRRSRHAFAWKEERTLSRARTLQYDKILFILEPSDQAKAAIRKRVTVVDYLDGRLSIRYKAIELAYRTFDKFQQVDQGAIIENKRLGAALAFIRDEQLRREPGRRSTKAPRQRDVRLFKVGLSQDCHWSSEFRLLRKSNSALLQLVSNNVKLLATINPR